MNTLDKHTAFILMTIAVLLIQLVNPITTLADGETPVTPTETTVTPPPPEPTETVLSVTDSPTPVLATGTPEPPSATPATPTPEDISTPTLAETTTPEPPATETTENQTPLLETVGTIADTTSVVVLDENGQPVPLASQGAAETVATSDPMWCPDGVLPGGTGCTPSGITTVSALITELTQNGYSGPGTVYFTSSYSVNDASFNGYVLENLTNLTIQGGWNGQVDTNYGISGNTIFNVPIGIYFFGDVTLNNISINNVNGTGFTSNGNDSTTINESSFSNNTNGVTINNIVQGTGNVTIQNTYFGNNTSIGLGINEANDIHITNSMFTNNGTGTWIRLSPQISIENSIFTSNGTGVFLYKGITNITNSIFTENNIGVDVHSGYYGGSIVRISDSTLQGNQIGVNITGVHPDEWGGNNVYVSISKFHKNEVGINITSCEHRVYLDKDTVTSLEKDGGIQVPVGCDITPIPPAPEPSSSQGKGEFELNCIGKSGFALNLPNGDLVYIFCPVSGKVRVSRLDNTSLPEDLPDGYTYASAFNLEILQGIRSDTPIPVITEGGHIKASFDGSSLQPGASYSILYFDEATSTWIRLKDFMLDERGNPRIFDLKPGEPDNQGRQILSGVKLDESSGSPRVEVSTNFPGIFVLAQH